MTPSSLVILADRGSLKAYQVNETPTRGPSLKLIQAFDVTDAHGRIVDKVTDLAGRFPVTETAGPHRGAASIAEPKLETEIDRRILQTTRRSDRQNREGGWSGRLVVRGAAEIHAAIVNLLPPAVRQSIVEHVKSDLVKVEPAKLVAHFRSLQPI